MEGGSVVGTVGTVGPKQLGASPKLSEEQLKNVGHSRLSKLSYSDSQLPLTDSHKVLHGLTV